MQFSFIGGIFVLPGILNIGYLFHCIFPWLRVMSPNTKLAPKGLDGVDLFKFPEVTFCVSSEHYAMESIEQMTYDASSKHWMHTKSKQQSYQRLLALVSSLLQF
jgi:hypothetical protein